MGHLAKNYLFTSERLGFRAWHESDLSPFAQLNADPEVMEFFPGTLSLEEVQAMFAKLKDHHNTHGFTYYAVDELSTQEFIGMVGMAHQTYKSAFTPAIDIGWRLRRSSWGLGYATEGAKRCLEFAFSDLKIEKIISVCVRKNFKSENIMKKLGMQKKGYFDHPKVLDNPELASHVCYEILAGDLDAPK